MRRLTFAAFGLILAHFGPVHAQDGWKPISAGGMTVSMPCTGNWDTSTRNVPEAAMVVTNHQLGCKTGESFYLVGWTEIATKERLDGMTEVRASRDAMLKQAGGAVLLTSNEVAQDGSQGIEFTANLRGTVLLTCRTLFKGNRLYLVSAGTPLNQDRSADIKRLLTSIKIG